MPIGIETYEVLAKECYYVDKTELIEKIDAFPSTSVVLVARPRRFGKSTALSMIRCFFETGEDPAPYFEHTYIQSKGGAIWEKRGKYPVITLNFKNLHPASFPELLRELSEVIRLEYARHPEILECPLQEADRDFVSKVGKGELDAIDLGHSLSTLIRLLCQAHGENVIVLIDEYDGLIQEAAGDSQFYESAIRLFQTFYGTALKGNPMLRFCLLTGVFEIAKDSLTSSLNNPAVFTVLDDGLSPYFGFTEEETKALLEEVGYGEKLQEALSWYGGYRFGNSRIVNPWSIIQFLSKSGRLGAYWTNTSRNSLLERVIFRSESSAESLRALLSDNGGLSAAIEPTITYQDLNDSTSALVSSLTFLGYLSVVEEMDVGIYRVRLPNKEITSIFQKEIIDHYFRSSSYDLVFDFRKAFSSGDGETMQKVLETSLLSTINYPGFGSEGLYQGMILCLLAIAYRDATVEAEPPSGKGRCDILLKPRNGGDVCVCIE
ncbi:MAG: AAA family ATPase, partial [Bacilli bacterium]|nr:AAA family ATPase [Bacilli bacterium]